MTLATFDPTRFGEAAALPPGSPEIEPIAEHRLRDDAPDGHVAALDAGRVVARCSWWASGPDQPDGARPGAIGHFAAATSEAARAVLDAACGALAARGRTVAFGPLDGSTWRRYRFVTERGTREPFLMEPWNPEAWPAWWRDAGFEPAARYQSGFVGDLRLRDPRVEAAGARLLDAGVALRTLDLARWRDELAAIHALSLDSFRRNFLYAPIDLEAFLRLYEPLRARVVPAYVLLATCEGALAGYLLAFPDFAQAARGAPVRTLIIKTLAVRAGRRFGGLGIVLWDQVRARAVADGFADAIHALQACDNPVVNITARHGGVLRGYTLYRRALPPA